MLARRRREEDCPCMCLCGKRIDGERSSPQHFYSHWKMDFHAHFISRGNCWSMWCLWAAATVNGICFYMIWRYQYKNGKNTVAIQLSVLSGFLWRHSVFFFRCFIIHQHVFSVANILLGNWMYCCYWFNPSISRTTRPCSRVWNCCYCSSLLMLLFSFVFSDRKRVRLLHTL